MADEKPTEHVKIHHKRSGFFRTIFADGSWGGANAGGIVYLTFYSEHPAIPTSVSYPLDKDGNVINEMSAEGDEGYHREMEVNVALSIPAAMQVRATLDSFIRMAVEELKKANQKVEAARKPTEIK